jgi:zinc protease
MKRQIALFIVLSGLAGWSLAGSETFERVLGNGMKIIVKPDHRAPVAVSQLWYRVGSMDETYGTTGVAHVLEHMMFQGTPEVSGGEFSRRIAAAGGRENAFTTSDDTVYFQTLQRDRLDLAFRLEADRMTNLTLAPKDYDKEIQVVMEERRLRTEDKPQALLYEQLMATAFEAHPYQHPVIGWMEDLRHMTVADVRNWYHTWYAPDNATLVVVGDVDPEGVFDLAERYFGPIPARHLPIRKTIEEPQPLGKKEVTVRAPSRLPRTLLAWRVPHLADPAKDWEPYALEVLAGVLDGYASARLPRVLVNEERVAVEAGASYDPVSRGPALFLVGATPAEGKTVGQVIQASKDVLDGLKQKEIGDSELDRVKAQVLAGQVFHQDSLFYQAMEIGTWDMAGLDYRALDQRFDRIRKVTAAQVQEVARKYFTDDRLTLAVLDPLPVSPAKAEMPDEGMEDVHVR